MIGATESHLSGIPRALALGVLALATEVGASGGTVVTQVVRDGVDITRDVADAKVVFLPNPPQQGFSKENALRCALTEPCRVPPGSYRVEIEHPQVVAAIRPMLTVGSVETEVASIRVHVIASVSIELPGGALPAGSTLQVTDEKSGEIYSTRVAADGARLSAPARPLLLCGLDTRRAPLPCTRLRPGKDRTVRVPDLPDPPRGRGQAFIGLLYPSENAKDQDESPALSFATPGAVVKADVVIPRVSGGFYGVWLNLPVGQGQVAYDSKVWALEKPLSVDVPERGIAVRTKIPLVSRPTLNVTLASPEKLGAGRVSVELFGCGEQADESLPPPIPACSRVTGRDGEAAGQFTFNGLRPALYGVRWQKAPFEGASWVDLRDGKSRNETLRMDFVEAEGTVTSSGRGLPAKLVWNAVNTGAKYTVQTDEDGRYRVVVGQSGEYGVGISSSGTAPFSQTVTLGKDRCCDFEVPANRVRVLVQDLLVKPIAGARVAYDVTKPHSKDRLAFGTQRTDAEGRAKIGALPNGTLGVRVFAEGFRTATAEPIEITAETRERELLVTLTPGAGIAFKVRQPGGAPAPRAMVWSDPSSAVVWGNRADENGAVGCDEALSAGAGLVAFDASGRMGFFRFSGAKEQILDIPVPGPPVTVVFRSPDGTPLAARNVVLGVDGIMDVRRFAERSLASGSDTASRADGSLRILGLPARGALTLYPLGRPDLAVTRDLPVADPVLFTLPLEDFDRK